MKYVSDFVKNQQYLKSLIKTRSNTKMLWDSTDGKTYIKKKHGELK